MRMRDEQDDSASSEEMRTFRDIADALDRSDVDALAAALSRTDDPAPRPPGVVDDQKKVGGAGDRSSAVRPLTGLKQTKRWSFWNVFRFLTRNDRASQDSAPH
jgi:hypothetical protein